MWNNIRHIRFRGAHRLQRVHPNHVRIAKGIISVALFLLVAKLIGAFKEMAIAHRYGVSGVVDAYVLAFTFTGWLPVVLWSVGGFVLVPILVALKNKPYEEKQFLKELNGTAIQLGLLTTLLMIGFGSYIISLLARGWNAETQALASRFAWHLAPMGFLLVLSAGLSIRLQALEKQSYTLLEAMPSLGVLLFLLLLPNHLDGTPLIWGTLFGAAVQLGLLIWIVGKAYGLGGIAFRRRSPWWKSMYASLSFMTAGQVVLSLTNLVDYAFAARLGEGAVAALGYSNRLISLLTGLTASAIGRALLPVLSQTVADGKLQLGLVQAKQWAGMIFLASGLASMVGWWLAPEVVALVFQRGQFTAGDTETVARIFRFALLQLPFYCSGTALVQWLAANGRYSLLAGLGALGIVVKILLNAALTPAFGVAGVALSTGIMYLVNAVILFALNRR